MIIPLVDYMVTSLIFNTTSYGTITSFDVTHDTFTEHEAHTMLFKLPLPGSFYSFKYDDENCLAYSYVPFDNLEKKSFTSIYKALEPFFFGGINDENEE